MKLCWLLLFFSGCLSQGCQVTPMPANKLFGTSNPKMIMSVPGYGKMEVPTDFKGRFKIDKNPDGTLKIDFTIASDASDVVDAEGRRIPMMDATRASEFAMVVEARKVDLEREKIWLGALAPVLDKFLGLAMAPKPATPEMQPILTPTPP